MTLIETGTQVRHGMGDRFNLAQDSKSFDCKFLEAGFVSYRDCGGKLELLRKETIDRCMASVVGIPVTIGHVEVTSANRENVQQGVVHEWYFNSEDGWFHVKGVIDTEEAKNRINSGERPSCGYEVLDLGPGAVDHGIRFDQEITDLKFNHLAIVAKPRYDGATFRLNSVSNPTMNVFKFLKKLVTRENGADGKPVDTVKTETHELSGDSETEIDGQKVRLNELFETYLKETAEAFTITPEDALEISGKTVTMGQLVDAYRKNKARANVAPPTETPEQKTAREAAEKTQRDNAAAEEEKKRAAGRENFFTLQTARTQPSRVEGISTSSGSLKERVERGAKKY